MNILPLDKLNDLQVGAFMFSAIHGLLPSELSDMFVYNRSLHAHNTRHKDKVHQIRYRLNIRKYTVRIVGPILWNTLPDDLCKSPNVKIFRNRYKKILLQSLS